MKQITLTIKELEKALEEFRQRNAGWRNGDLSAVQAVKNLIETGKVGPK